MNVSIPAIDREAPPAYAELHCCSNFSFLRGASHPEELVAQAQALGYAALALTDECSLAGVVRAHAAARDLGIQLIIGSEFELSDGPRLVLLATDRASYGNLSELITRARRAASKGRYRLGRADVERLAGGCLALWLPTALDEVERHRADGPWIARAFPRRAWIAVELVRDGRDRARLAALTALGRDLHLPLVAGGDVHMHARSRRALQDVLTAIRLGTTVEAAVSELLPNGERCLRARKTLAKLYPPELLAETLRIAAHCRFSLDELRYEYPEELVPAGETPASHLRQLTEAGLQRRWPAGAPPKVRQLVEHELALIAELHYEPYFLTVHDIVHFARARGILCQGRGSAANSAVCFGLGITEVDPARIETLFERFVSKERNEPPDIDVDFEHERREEVIQYLYSKYGRERAALAATVITYRPKSAVRDVGKVLGFSLEQVDSLAGNLAWWDGGILPDRLEEAGFDTQNPKVRLLLQLVQTLIGFPRHLSQHVGGFVIARDALSRLVPIENAAMPERTVIQWDKDDLDALGLLKVDVLGLGMLTAIRKGFDLVRAYRGQELTMATIPPEDPEVYAMIQQADTTGVFQIESRAQMAMLPRLKPACFYDLVIEVAIMRPGPIQGDMVHPYLRRRQGLEPVSYPSEAVREVLARTLGVPIFQEQVIKLAMVAAGFTPGEADRLRRSMAAFRRRGGIDQFEARLIEGMRARGYSETFARQIFRQIEGFGEYGFPESHSASFALLVYVSAWLKRYEPAAFLCALLNSQPMGFYAPTQLVQDARRHGVEVRAVDVRASGWDCRLETDLPGDSTSYPWRDPCSSDQPQPGLPWPGVRRRGCTLSASAKPPAHPAVRLGFRLVKGLTQAGAERLVQARDQTPFAGVEDLAFRARLAAHDMQALATADALRGLIGHRRRAHWAAAGVEAPSPLLQRVEIPEALPLLRTPTEGEDIVTDYASLGLTLRRHPVALLRAVLAKRSLLAAAEVRALQHGKPVSTAGLVICRQHPSSGNGVIFVTLEDETGHTNIIVWPKLAERQHRELLHARLLGVVGEVQREGEVLHVLAKKLEDYSGLLGELTAPSRDFR